MLIGWGVIVAVLVSEGFGNINVMAGSGLSVVVGAGVDVGEGVSVSCVAGDVVVGVLVAVLACCFSTKAKVVSTLPMMARTPSDM